MRSLLFRGVCAFVVGDGSRYLVRPQEIGPEPSDPPLGGDVRKRGFARSSPTSQISEGTIEAVRGSFSKGSRFRMSARASAIPSSNVDLPAPLPPTKTLRCLSSRTDGPIRETTKIREFDTI